MEPGDFTEPESGILGRIAFVRDADNLQPACCAAMLIMLTKPKDPLAVRRAAAERGMFLAHVLTEG
jgi:hypothetical protein